MLQPILAGTTTILSISDLSIFRDSVVRKCPLYQSSILGKLHSIFHKTENQECQPRFEPGAAGWEPRIPPLCNAAPMRRLKHFLKLLLSSVSNRNHWNEAVGEKFNLHRMMPSKQKKRKTWWSEERKTLRLNFLKDLEEKFFKWSYSCCSVYFCPHWYWLL